MTGKMRELKTLGCYFLIALVAEFAASWWTWLGAPTDSLRALYEDSFAAYESERIIPWLVGFTLLCIMRLMTDRPAKYY
jgi:hypothetical protein